VQLDATEGGKKVLGGLHKAYSSCDCDIDLLTRANDGCCVASCRASCMHSERAKTGGGRPDCASNSHEVFPRWRMCRMQVKLV
jgi:hypothetical protein